MENITNHSAIKNYLINRKEFNFNHAYVMGILNVTPDSFSDGGKYTNIDTAVEYCLEMIEQGADIIDIGGESTRPGAKPVNEQEELDRVIPIIQILMKENPDTVISVDTTKEIVAREALKNGAAIVNDISGLTFDTGIINTVKDFDAGLIIMHIKGDPRTMQNNPQYENLIGEVFQLLTDQSNLAEHHGINKIFIDPGIGFGKSVQDNFKLISKLKSFTKIGYPIVIGLSRKSFIGKTLNLNIDERDIATSILNAVAISNGAKIVRTHNVKLGAETCKLLNQTITLND